MDIGYFTIFYLVMFVVQLQYYNYNIHFLCAPYKQNDGALHWLNERASFAYLDHDGKLSLAVDWVILTNMWYFSMLTDAYLALMSCNNTVIIIAGIRRDRRRRIHYYNQLVSLIIQLLINSMLHVTDIQVPT